MDYKTVNGTRIPALGFGTFELEPSDAHRMVRYALDVGYRHIDTAQAYKNEDDVGRAIKQSGVDRSEIFLTTKVWIDRFHAGDLEKSADESLQRLDSDYLDLLLLHWPNPEVELKETLQALMAVKQSGKAKNIGVSNFPSHLVDETVNIIGRDQLFTNQVEYHVFLTQETLREKARELGFALTAYCPLAQGKVVNEPILKDIGERHGKSAPQVALRWLLQQEAIVIPRTTKEKNADSNLDVFDFDLSEDERRRIEDQLQGDGRVINPGFAPQWDAA